MSLGSRIAIRGRAAIIASLVSTPREPLLFLYPQWARSSSTASQAAAFKKPTDASTENSTESSIYTSNSASIDPLIDARDPLNSSSSAKTPPGEFRTKAVKKRANIDSAQYKPLAIRNQLSNPTKSPGSEALLAELSFAKEEPVCTPPATSILDDVQSRARNILHAAERKRISEQTAHHIREEYQENRRLSTNNWIPDWRVILRDLTRNTPHHGQWFDRQIQVIVPPSEKLLFMCGLDDDMRVIGDKYGCSIELGPSYRAKHEDGIFVLSGSRSAISRTLADVLRLAPDAKITTNDTPRVSLDESRISCSAGVLETVNIRPVISIPRSNSKIRSTRPEEIPKPPVWTKHSFLDYVKAVTTFEPPRSVLEKEAREQYFDEVRLILHGLFRDPDEARKAAITGAACHEALQYFVKFNRIDQVRVLFVRMELLGMPLSPETFNIMLRGAAKQEDLHNFHFILHLMLRRGLVPNGATWTAFMMTLPDFQLKMHVATKMKRGGLLRHVPTMKAVCEQLIKPEVELSLDAFQDQATFVSHMDARYGRNWLSLDSANRVLNELGARGLISRCWDFLHLMDSRYIRPDGYSVNTILNHCKQIDNLGGAIEFLQNFSAKWGLEPDEDTYDILFRMAWQERHYNMAKVVWKYACIAGKTSYGMRYDVLHSMRAGWRMPNTPKLRFECYAGTVVSGSYYGWNPTPAISEFVNRPRLASIDTAEMLQLPLIKSELLPTPPDLLPVYKPFAYVYSDSSDKQVGYEVKDEEFEKLYETLWQRFSVDLHMTKFRVTPRYSFEESLQIAWNMDKNWRESGAYRDWRLSELTAKAIRVDLKVEDFGKTFWTSM
ncbi:uncharacterized protein LY89DRAFT_218804 [Mollisia scopiformis]|uniref:Pentatricopeptide repeat domain-containing protein n=1 Tax=Mollisia scopiformis TaxID=149040 RepID=A0A194WVJ4_MOLSC|nr:uncharacterized protein LY89DRAFT_218804 [Mollisia scopiformis]KUJ11990.1 hypothetical protein LY89DRAFT_218804 [Mollisia scopiformis]